MSVNILTDFQGNQLPLANDNLLINGDFKIWQRGETVTMKTPSGYKYFADRWNIYWNSSSGYNYTLSKVSNGMKINTNQSNAQISQFIEPLEDGKDYVASCSINNNIHVLNITGGTNISNDYLQYQLDRSARESDRLFVNGLNDNDVVNWVKLELGSIVTPFIPRLHAYEWFLCQRYYQILGKIIAARYDYSSNYSYFTGCRFSEMRAIPKVSIISNENLVYQPHETNTKSISYFSLNGDKDATDLTVYLDAEIY